MVVHANDTAVGAGLILGAAVLWGTVGPAQVLAGGIMEPAALGGWRLLVGGLALLALTGPTAGRLRALARRPVLVPLLACAGATGLYQAAFLVSVDRTGAALATVVALGAAPAATGVCARWIIGERVGAAWLASTLAAVAGCALLLAPGGGTDLPGLLLAVTAGACYGLYTVSAKHLATTAPAAHLPTVSALSMTAGSLVLLPWLATGTGPQADPRALGLIAWLGLATAAAAYWLFSLGLPRIGATMAGTLSLAEPLTAALLGVLLLGEHLTAPAWLGCALILGGLTAACLPRRTAGTPAPRSTASPADAPG